MLTLIDIEGVLSNLYRRCSLRTGVDMKNFELSPPVLVDRAAEIQTAHSLPPSRTPLSMQRDVDVVLAGGGLVGTSSQVCGLALDLWFS